MSDNTSPGVQRASAAEAPRGGVRYRGNRYGAKFLPTWPHISLGVSCHLGRPIRFWHLSLHLPIGVLIVGMVGAGEQCGGTDG